MHLNYQVAIKNEHFIRMEIVLWLELIKNNIYSKYSNKYGYYKLIFLPKQLWGQWYFLNIWGLCYRFIKHLYTDILGKMIININLKS